MLFEFISAAKFGQFLVPICKILASISSSADGRLNETRNEPP